RNCQEQWREDGEERQTTENIHAPLQYLELSGSNLMCVQFRVQKLIHCLEFFLSGLLWLRIDAQSDRQLLGRIPFKLICDLFSTFGFESFASTCQALRINFGNDQTYDGLSFKPSENIDVRLDRRQHVDHLGKQSWRVSVPTILHVNQHHHHGESGSLRAFSLSRDGILKKLFGEYRWKHPDPFPVRARRPHTSSPRSKPDT